MTVTIFLSDVAVAGGGQVSGLWLALLGPPRIRVGGVPIQVDTRKAIALLAYLAVTGERHGRDQLAELLWPEHDSEHARAALRRTLSALNRALGDDRPGMLQADRASVGLDPGAAELDLRRSEDLLAACRGHGHPPEQVCEACVAPLTEAVALHRGDFMAGFALRDAAGFEDWQLLQAERLRRGLAGALDRLVLGLAGTGAWERALEAAHRRVSLDQLHEPAHRQLMQVYAWSGQRAAALRHYRECVRVLDQELGVPPLEETTALYQAIASDSPPPVPELLKPTGGGGRPAAAATAPAPAPATAPAAAPAAATAAESVSYPLVGRAEEWAALLEAYMSARGDGRLVVVEGEAGIGKTRLAEDFLAEARRRGAATISARCYEGQRDLAYAPFIEGMRAALPRGSGGSGGLASEAGAQAPGPPSRAERSPPVNTGSGGLSWVGELPAHWAAEAARLLPELTELRSDLPPAPSLDGPGAQSRFFEGMRQVMLAALRGRPSSGAGVLLVDDLQWADDASLDLLTYLVRRLRGQPLVIMVTWRGEEVPRGHRLRRLLVEAQRAGMATRLLLGRLGEAEVAELVRAVAPGRADTARDLHRETEGLPFFLVEYLATMTASGDGAAAPALPSGVRELLRARLGSVGETGWQLLTAAAVIGRSFDFELVREASGRSEEEAVAALEELLVRGLVHEVDEGERAAAAYDFNHEKLRALAYEETSLPRRRLLHRRVATALAGRGRGRADGGPPAGLVAHHFQLAGADEQAAHWFALAGERARALYASHEALADFRAALALGHPGAAALHQAIGDVQTLLGQYDAALSSYEAAAARSTPAGLPALEHKLGNLHLRRGDFSAAERHLEAALHSPASGAPAGGNGTQEEAARQARVAADRSLAAHHRGLPGQARDFARQALDLAERSGDTLSLAQAHNILGVLANSLGDQASARRHLQQSLTLAETLPDPSARVAALNNLALVHRATGDLDAALRHAETALELCVAQGDRHREAALHSNLADLLHAAGRADEAMEHLKRAAAIFGEVGRLEPEIWKLVEW
jgi:DNA-binding SARP family transcriptional activator